MGTVGLLDECCDAALLQWGRDGEIAMDLQAPMDKNRNNQLTTNTQ